MSVQFGSYDDLETRRELVILFERLGEGAPDPQWVRAKWLELLITKSMTGLKTCPVEVDVAQCTAVGAYVLFVQFVGVLGVKIDDAARLLDDCVKKRAWMA